MEVAFSVNYAHHLKQYTYSYIMYRTLCQVHTVQSQSYLKTTENTEEPAWNLSLKKIRIVQILFWCTLYIVHCTVPGGQKVSRDGAASAESGGQESHHEHNWRFKYL